MSVHPQAQAMLDILSQVDMNPENSTVAEMRVLADAEPTGMPAVKAVENRTVSLGGYDIPLRIYTPEGEGPHSLMVFFHGGGWVICSLDTHDSTCRALANACASVVVSVDYRMAPEDKYPAAVEDCFEATLWAQHNASSLNADAGQLVIAGDSAGGNLVAAVGLMARDKNKAGEPAPDIKYQVPMYPVTHHNFNTDSYRDNAEGYYLTTNMMRWFWGHYLPNDAAGQESYASPLVADLAGLPPSLVITAEYDPLRDEGEAFAAALRSAGSEAELIRYDGQIHGFIGMADLIDDGRAAIACIGDRVRQVFA